MVIRKNTPVCATCGTRMPEARRLVRDSEWLKETVLECGECEIERKWSPPPPEPQPDPLTPEEEAERDRRQKEKLADLFTLNEPAKRDISAEMTNGIARLRAKIGF